MKEAPIIENAADDLLSTNQGAVAQLGEHLLCKQGVSGSIPLSSTKLGFIMDLRKYLLMRYFLKSVINEAEISFNADYFI